MIMKKFDLIEDRLVYTALHLIHIRQYPYFLNGERVTFEHYLREVFPRKFYLLRQCLALGRKIQSYNLLDSEIEAIEKEQRNIFSLLILANYSSNGKQFVHNCLNIKGSPKCIFKTLQRERQGNGHYGLLPFLATLGRSHVDRELILAVTGALKRKHKIKSPGKAALAPYILWYVTQLHPKGRRSEEMKKLCQKHNLPESLIDILARD